jgi:hypothetical protein
VATINRLIEVLGPEKNDRGNHADKGGRPEGFEVIYLSQAILNRRLAECAHPGVRLKVRHPAIDPRGGAGAVIQNGNTLNACDVGLSFGIFLLRQIDSTLTPSMKSQSLNGTTPR